MKNERLVFASYSAIFFDVSVQTSSWLYSVLCYFVVQLR